MCAPAACLGEEIVNRSMGSGTEMAVSASRDKCGETEQESGRDGGRR